MINRKVFCKSDPWTPSSNSTALIMQAIGHQFHTHTHTHTRLMALFPGLPAVSRYQKGKPIWILLRQETVSGCGISWAICKSASRSRQIATPAHHHCFLQARCPSCRPTNSVKALKAQYQHYQYIIKLLKLTQHTRRCL